MTDTLPYKIACLCDLRDRDGRILLLRRLRAPNQGLCSPIGGKLDMATGESPAQCAQREIMEEAGIHVPIARLHLAGLISESAFEKRGHWLIFYYRVLGPVEVPPHEIPEGRLEWHRPDEITSLPLPETDRRIIWPLINRHDREMVMAGAAGKSHAVGHSEGGGGNAARPGFFAVHIDCAGEELCWQVEQEAPGCGR
ncbi:MAG: NUDIX domain-containing protein [Phycisphaerales bacterium]|nr:NUDIX domain-containing protein [Phycisphaerales bacterium]